MSCLTLKFIFRKKKIRAGLLTQNYCRTGPQQLFTFLRLRKKVIKIQYTIMDRLKNQYWMTNSQTPSERRKQFIKTRNPSSKPRSSASSRNHSISVTSNRHQKLMQSRPFSSQLRNRSFSINNSQLYENLIRLKETQQNSKLYALKKGTEEAIKSPNREIRLKLSANLRTIHPFFSKINKNICEALVLLGKISTYFPNTIHSYHQYNSPICYKLSPKQNYLGFILYGKIQLINLTHFYSHVMNLRGLNTTIYEHNYIRENVKEREKQIYEYDLRVLEESAVLWISKQALYLIRKECFLSMDLKYMFHEFQNHLKYSLIHKKAKLEKK